MNSLQAMGFTAAQARTALMRNNGNLEMAAEFLLSSGNSAATAAAAPAHQRTNASSTQDAALQNALQESLQSEEQRLYKQAQELSLQDKTNSNSSNNKNKPRSAAANRAGQAALQRISNPTTSLNTPSSSSFALKQHHPAVHVPSKLQDKTKEEQILRCADRLKGHPHAVDTLHKALTALYNNPNHPKFQQIDTTTVAFQRSLANAPGAIALLQAMNYVKSGHRLVLTQQDAALIYLGKTALEGIQKYSPEYQQEKAKLKFGKDLQAIRESADSSTEEAVKRAAFLQKCPTEPTSGRGALLQVVFGDDHTVKRRFDGDDVLRDVVHWLGGHGSTIYDNLMSGEWCLVDRNRYPVAPLSLQQNLDKTLQYVGCWPSGKLELLPMALAVSEESAKKVGSSRGLGAAPSETL